MKTVTSTARARQLTNSVVFKGNHTAIIGRVTFTYSAKSGFVDFTDVDAYLEVNTIFSICENMDVVNKYTDHMQAITLALGFYTYCVGQTEITIVSEREYAHVPPRVDIFGEYVVGGSIPRPERRTYTPRPVVRADISTAGFIGGLIVIGAIVVLSALLSDDHRS